jgi:hypothetical protein
VKSSAIHEEALTEFDAAIAYYEENERVLGLRFHAAVQHAIEIIERHPRMARLTKQRNFESLLLAIFLTCSSIWISMS